jgi:hypothetical protein
MLGICRQRWAAASGLRLLTPARPSPRTSVPLVGSGALAACGTAAYVVPSAVDIGCPHLFGAETQTNDAPTHAAEEL